MIEIFGNESKLGNSASLRGMNLDDKRIFKFDSYFNELDFYGYDDQIQKHVIVNSITNYRDSRILNGIELEGAIFKDGVIIAPGYGLVQFVSPVSSDTFFLQRTNF